MSRDLWSCEITHTCPTCEEPPGVACGDRRSLRASSGTWSHGGVWWLHARRPHAERIALNPGGAS